MKKILISIIAIVCSILAFAAVQKAIHIFKNGILIQEYPIEADETYIVEVNDVLPPEYIDLGLPSGLLWASCNIGANYPEDFGEYYAWGEINTKNEYTTSNSSTFLSEMTDYSGNATYDAATTNRGNNWRTPTEKEWEELISSCTWTWTTQNGITGYEVVGPNGKSIFLPYVGYMNGANNLTSLTYYQSSTPYDNSFDTENRYFSALRISTSVNTPFIRMCNRWLGCQIRPVYGNNGNNNGDNNGNTNSESGLYLGVIGFNQALYPHPITQLTNESKSSFDTFIDAMTAKNGTLLYYSVDEAINSLQRTTFPDDLHNVAIVTFTDGLDQGSLMLNPSYASNDEYLNAINYRISSENVGGREIMAYSIGIRGSDVSDVTQFSANLKKIASSAENATEVTDMSQVNAKFQDIAEQLSQTSYLQTVTLRMPGQANGTKVRFTFDNVTNANMSQLYIEGDFNLTNKTLENVQYHGMNSTSGTTVKGVVDGIFVSFVFDGISLDSGKLISNNYIKEWTYITSSASWQINSEFDKDEESEIVVTKTSAAIMLVLDNSSSLGMQFSSMQNHAKSFIATLLNYINNSNSNPSDPTNPTYPSDNFSTTPIDLSLAIWNDSDNTRYYITQEQYQQMNGDLSGYSIEGLAVVNDNGNFIIDLHNASSNQMVYDAAELVYSSFIPTENQGITISARFNDISAALTAFSGDALSSSSKYWTKYNSNIGYYYAIHGSGGALGSMSPYNSCYVRRVNSITNKKIVWTSL